MKKLLGALAVIFGGYMVGTALQPERDETGAIIEEGALDAFGMRVGDCFNDVVAVGAGATQVTNVPAVPCAQPHDNEVYAVFDVTLPGFPGSEAMSQQAFDGCLERFEAFVGKDYQSSSLDVTHLYPTQESWDQNDREVICAVYDVNLNKLTGTMKGRAI
jgi:hypothetical protein